MTPNKLRTGSAALPVTDRTWRLGDEGFIIDEKSRKPIAVAVTAITSGQNINSSLTLKLRQAVPVSLIPDELLRNVPPAALFKTEEEALATLHKQSFDVSFTISGAATLKASDRAAVRNLAQLTPLDDIQWDRTTLCVTGIVPHREKGADDHA